MFVSCHLAHIFVFPDVPTLTLKSHGISAHVTVRYNFELSNSIPTIEDIYFESASISE